MRCLNCGKEKSKYCFSEGSEVCMKCSSFLSKKNGRKVKIGPIKIKAETIYKDRCSLRFARIAQYHKENKVKLPMLLNEISFSKLWNDFGADNMKKPIVARVDCDDCYHPDNIVILEKDEMASYIDLISARGIKGDDFYKERKRFLMQFKYVI